MNTTLDFRGWMMAETFQITANRDKDVAAAVAHYTGTRVEGMAEFIEYVYYEIISGQYEEPADPYDGTVIRRSHIARRLKGKLDFVDVRAVVYPVSAAKRPTIKGQADLARDILRIYWDKRNSRGVAGGKPVTPRILKVAITHELVHLLDPGLDKERNAFRNANPDFFAPGNEEAVERWREKTRIDSYDPDEGEETAPTDAQYRSYLVTPEERLAWRTGFSYELADRAAFGGTHDPDASDDLADNNPLERDAAMGWLRKSGRGDIPMGDRARRTYYDQKPKLYNRISKDAYKYLDSMYQGDRPVEDKIQGRQPGTFSKMAAERKAAREAERQRQLKARPWWRKAAAWMTGGE